MNSPVNDPLDEQSYSRLVGERLRSIRQQKNLSLNEVETSTQQEFKASVMGAYERGERVISVLRLERLARFYGVKLRIDVAKLSALEGDQFKMLERLLRMIQVQRQDFNGKVITVRANDTRAIAVMLDVSIDDVGTKLAELDLLFVPPNAT